MRATLCLSFAVVLVALCNAYLPPTRIGTTITRPNNDGRYPPIVGQRQTCPNRKWLLIILRMLTRCYEQSYYNQPPNPGPIYYDKPPPNYYYKPQPNYYYKPQPNDKRPPFLPKSTLPEAYRKDPEPQTNDRPDPEPTDIPKDTNSDSQPQNSPVEPRYSFDYNDKEASSDIWDKKKSLDYENTDDSTNGDRKITENNSGDSSEQREQGDSSEVDDSSSTNDGKGGVADTELKTKDASRKLTDNNSGFANANSYERFSNGDRTIKAQGSKYKDNLGNDDRSSETTKNDYKKSPDGVETQNSSNDVAASSDKIHDLGKSAFDVGNIIANNGQNVQKYEDASNAEQRLKNSAASSNTDINNIKSDGTTTQQEQFKDKGASAILQDDRKDIRVSNDELKEGDAVQRLAKSSLGASSAVDDQRTKEQSKLNALESPEGNFSEQQKINSDSGSKTLDKLLLAKDADERKDNEGQQYTSNESKNIQNQADKGASVTNAERNAGITDKGQYNEEKNDKVAVALKKNDVAEATKKISNLLNKLNGDHSLLEAGSLVKNSAGESTSSNEHSDKGEGTGNEKPKPLDHIKM